MILKGIIEGIMNDNNQIKVRIPQLHKIQSAPNATPTAELPNASICSAPGIIPAYKQGDVVFVGFEGNDINNPIIIGALYNKSTFNKIYVDINVNNANIKSKTTMSQDVEVEGNKLTSPYVINAKLSKLSTQIDSINENLNTQIGANRVATPTWSKTSDKKQMLTEFNTYLLTQVAHQSIYVLGAQGQFYKDYIKDGNDDAFVTWITKREHDDKTYIQRILTHVAELKNANVNMGLVQCFDCSGLGMFWLQNVTSIYPGDLNANGMYSKCTPIEKADIKIGDWVFKTNPDNKVKSHIGYVVDIVNNVPQVVESRGRAYGVVKRALTASNWDSYGRPEVFKDAIES